MSSTVLQSTLKLARVDPQPLAGSSEDRKQRERQAHEDTLARGAALQEDAAQALLAGDYERAARRAHDATTAFASVLDKTSTQLVPCYLLSGEASAALGKVAQAEEALAHAQWLLVKNSVEEPRLRARIHRLAGRLQQAHDNFEEAIREHSYGVYWAARAAGPYSIDAADAVFHLGAAFLDCNNVAGALDMFAAVVRIWDSQTSVPDMQCDITALAEACGVIERVANLREQLLGVQNVATAEAHAVLAQLLERVGALDRALASGARAAEVLQSCQVDGEAQHEQAAALGMRIQNLVARVQQQLRDASTADTAATAGADGGAPA